MNGDAHAICPICHCDYTLGGRCDCQRIDLQPEEIPGAALNGAARAALHAAARAFEDPAVRADFERWQAERQQREPAQ